MKRILIVEDETIEREFVNDIIQRHFSNDFELINSDNSFHALDIVRERDIQIVFMDINIPGTNGLVLLEQIKAIQPNIISYIITSYSRFEYAHQAIKLDVQDYILKPTTKEVIFNLLTELKENTPTMNQKQQNYYTNQRVKTLLYHILSQESFEVLKDEIKNLDIVINDLKLYIIYNVLATELHAIEELFDIYSIKQSIQEFGPLTLIFFEDPPEKLDRIESHLEKSTYHLCTFRKNYTMEYQESLQLLVQELLPQLKISSLTLDNVHHDVQRLNSYSEYLIYLNFITLTLFSYPNKEVIKYLTLLESIFHSLNPFISYSYTSKPTIANTYGKRNRFIELQMILNLILEPYFISLNVNHRSSNETIILKSTQFIKNHYTENISLDDLAEYLSLSTYHVSKVLNSKDNNSFTEILNRIRIEEAKNRLLTNDSIKEIAYGVGYRSTSYFSRVFKKYVGLSPKQYKYNIALNYENDFSK